MSFTMPWSDQQLLSLCCGSFFCKFSILCIYCNRNILLYFCCTFSKTGTHWHVALTDAHCSWYTYLERLLYR